MFGGCFYYFSDAFASGNISKRLFQTTFSSEKVVFFCGSQMERGIHTLIQRKRELHLISNGRQTLQEFAQVTALVHPWVTAIHLREKARSAQELWGGIQLLLSARVPPEKLYINDRADVAAAAQIQGVHLAYHSLEPQQVKPLFPRLRIGRSVHSIEEARQAEASGADYLLFGHVYATASKAGQKERGLDELASVTKAVSIPVVAIGGIEPGNVEEVLASGASGVAVMSGILDSVRPAHMAHVYYQHLIKGGDLYR